MADSYLQLAEEVLRARGKPLSAKLILSEAQRFGFMPEHLSGATMHKTLQARISDDINIFQQDSKFYRVGVGTYFLRDLSSDPTLPWALRKEKEPPGRTKSIDTCRILHSNELPKDSRCLVATDKALSWVRRNNSFKYAHNRLPSETLVGTFTIVRQGNRLLLHNFGKFSHFYSEEVAENSTIGFRRYIEEFDDDIFKSTEFGVDFSSAREVIRNIAVGPEKDLIDDRKIRQSIKLLGAAFEAIQHSIFLIAEVNLEQVSNQGIFLRERKDVRNPRWLWIDEIDLHLIDPLSRAILDSGLVE
ncbi:winged helix-turn-helix domain-containing protein [Psychromarinibacter sp. C21-152]|uniref:Winged helix-turn-helix domain-containing protein n=1 Tax=Psychromarinibacter sediminicola TaxID=3033385 RepID=A0AAE3NW96_9RHOB|nr:winged helix-turn-helix domain-containing protein [Psychromarinibacter sediminicola]MDF0602100.1 winged helix-turn-helix domain-containing protein [Psychromarinibacter sediminicola]